MREKPIAITTGEPAGIGPEVALKAAFEADFPLVLIGDRTLLASTAEKLGLPRELPANVSILAIPTAAPVISGHLDVRNSSYVVKTLEAA